MNYSKSPSSHIKGSPYGKQISDGPIAHLATVIEKTSAEDWKKRTQALESLVATIPTGSEYVEVEAWYNTPPTLRHLAWPLSQLLTDLRSTVVIKSCESIGELFAKCQMDARYLFKDLMPTVLQLHAQTVAVIKQSVQDMVLDIMSVTPCKMVMPIWLDRLKSDKSRTVREACALYLGTALQEWTEPGYLSTLIWEQVGTALTKALRDPAPTVRQNSKKGLEAINRIQPDVFDQLVENSDLARDVRVQKTLARIQSGEHVSDDVSVTSYGSRGASAASSRVRGGMRNNASVAGSKSALSHRRGPPNGISTMGRGARPREEPIPMTIGVKTPSNPPTNKVGGLGPPVRMPAPFRAQTIETPQKIEPKLEDEMKTPEISISQTVIDSVTTIDESRPETNPSNTSFDTTDTNESDLPVIANVNALREYAKSQGNSRRSSVLQERFARSATQSSEAIGSVISLEGALSTSERDSDSKLLTGASKGSSEVSGEERSLKDPSTSTSIPEHRRIAKALLEAHKKHVDLIMETLKVEMDALKEFETLMNGGEMTRPAEDEVLEYFESVGLCVEQRAKAGTILQKKMDKISKGVV